MTQLIKVFCSKCNKMFQRPVGRFNEARKFGWNQYCSKKCQNSAAVTRVEKTCGNPTCSKLVSRMLNQFKRSKSGLIFCSTSCAAIVSNKNRPERGAKLINCAGCGKKFKKWLTNNKRYCSKSCYTKVYLRKPGELLEIIRNSFSKLKRVPTRRELGNINDACRKIFGSWNNAVLAAGLIPNRSHDNRMYRRSSARALDGHLCDSVSELLIDNWLYANNIPHRRDANYPNTHHKADWEIQSRDQKVFIEYFGLANDSPRYDRTIREKKEMCFKSKIKLIPIYHWDLYPKKLFPVKIKNIVNKL